MNFFKALLALKAGKTIEGVGVSLYLSHSNPNFVTVDTGGNEYYKSLEEFEITLEMLLAEWEIIE